MKVITAASKTEALLKYEAKRLNLDLSNDNSPDSLAHASHLLLDIVKLKVTAEKAYRHLGWAQCIIHMRLSIKLEVFKRINYES